MKIVFRDAQSSEIDDALIRVPSSVPDFNPESKSSTLRARVQP